MLKSRKRSSSDENISDDGIGLPDDGRTITLGEVPPIYPEVDAETGATQTPTDDGGLLVDLEPSPQKDGEDPTDHNANLANHLNGTVLSKISSDLLQGIGADDQSRNEWLDTRAQGIRLLGLKIDKPGGNAETGGAPLEGMSTVRHPLLLEAVLRFQANARGEMLPSEGPVKVSDSLSETKLEDDLSEKLEKFFNYYLTVVAKEYYPDTDRMLFYVGFGGCEFKKVYNCPLRRRPVSESVRAEDLIVSNAANDLANCARTTHRILMRPSVLKRMQVAGAYRDIEIAVSQAPKLDQVKEEIAQTQGIDPNPQLPSDYEHTIYECYCELDIEGYEHEEDGEPTGLPLPYRVVIDEDSEKILEIRRNWEESDSLNTPQSYFVKYPFVPGLGFYDIGLVHILGNTTTALTAGWRMLLDNGMFSNFPGFIYAKLAGRQNTNEFRVGPGGGVGIETNGMSLDQMVMPLPYKDVSTAFSQLLDGVAATGQRVGGTAEMSIGEGRQDAPVGTTLALIEQAQKIMDAVHKRIHAAQSEEFQLLKKRFQEDPEAIDRVSGGKLDWSSEILIPALNDADIVPTADPNTPSHMHRLMKAMAIKQLQSSSPQLYDPKAVDTYILNSIGISDAEQFFIPPQPPQPAQTDPSIMLLQQQIEADKQKATLEYQAKMANIDNDLKIALIKAKSEADDRQSKEKIEGVKMADKIASEPHARADKIAQFQTRQPKDKGQ